MKNRVKKQVKDYEQKIDEINRPVDVVETPEKKKRGPNKWCLFCSKKYKEMKAKDPDLKYLDIVKNEDVRKEYMDKVKM